MQDPRSNDVGWNQKRVKPLGLVAAGEVHAQIIQKDPGLRPLGPKLAVGCVQVMMLRDQAELDRGQECEREKFDLKSQRRKDQILKESTQIHFASGFESRA